MGISFYGMGKANTGSTHTLPNGILMVDGVREGEEILVQNYLSKPNRIDAYSLERKEWRMVNPVRVAGDAQGERPAARGELWERFTASDSII